MAQHNHHNAKGEPLPKYVCESCKLDFCENCIDVLRAVFSQTEICKCSRINHTGEPVDQQLLDPDTHTVYGPGLEVNVDGEVNFK